MVDKGFLIDEDVITRGGVVIRPAFKNAKQQFNPLNSSVVGYIGSFMNTELINIHQVFKIAFTLPTLI
jgi:hypothetical protein